MTVIFYGGYYNISNDIKFNTRKKSSKWKYSQKQGVFTRMSRGDFRCKCVVESIPEVTALNPGAPCPGNFVRKLNCLPNLVNVVASKHVMKVTFYCVILAVDSVKTQCRTQICCRCCKLSTILHDFKWSWQWRTSMSLCRIYYSMHIRPSRNVFQTSQYTTRM